MARKVNTKTQAKTFERKNYTVQKGGALQQNNFIPYIYVEGQTERYYFQCLKQTHINNLKIVPGKYSTENLISLRMEINKVLSVNSKIYCFFDLDRIFLQGNEKERAEYDKIINSFSNQENVVFCDTLPSIEFWFLLHFESFKDIKQFKNQDEVKEELLKYLPEYEKGESKNWFSNFERNGSISNAIWRALVYKEKLKINPDISYSNAYKFYLDFKVFLNEIEKLINLKKDRYCYDPKYKFIEEKYKKLLN